MGGGFGQMDRVQASGCWEGLNRGRAWVSDVEDGTVYSFDGVSGPRAR